MHSFLPFLKQINLSGGLSIFFSDIPRSIKQRPETGQANRISSKEGEVGKRAPVCHCRKGVGPALIHLCPQLSLGPGVTHPSCLPRAIEGSLPKPLPSWGIRFGSSSPSGTCGLIPPLRICQKQKITTQLPVTETRGDLFDLSEST